VTHIQLRDTHEARWHIWS